MKKEKLVFGIICAILCEILFGFSFLFTKNVTNTISAMSLLSWRFTVAFVVFNLCVLTGIVKLNLKGKPLKPLFLIALLSPVLYFIGETLGIKFTTASESGAFIACIPIAALVSSAIVLKEKPSRLQAAGIAITTAGILLIVLSKGLDSSLNIFGYLMLSTAVITYSLFSVFAQKAAQFTSVEKTYMMMGFGAVVFTIIALVENAAAETLGKFISLPLTEGSFTVALLYLGIGCSIIAFLLINTAIAIIGTNRTASFVGICTVVTIAAGVVVLKESFTVFQVVGTVLVLGGVYMANILPKADPEDFHIRDTAGSDQLPIKQG